MTFGELKKLLMKRAERSELPINLPLDKWPIYFEGSSGPAMPLTDKHVAYGFVGGASAIVLEIG